jgi:hypothetical protein
VTQDVAALEAGRGAHGLEFIQEQLERPFVRGVQPVRAAAAELVVEHDLPTGRGHFLERMEVLVGHARAAVNAQQRPARTTLADDPETGLVTVGGCVTLPG